MKNLKGKDLVLAWEKSKEDGITQKEFAKSLNRTRRAVFSEILQSHDK